MKKISLVIALLLGLQGAAHAECEQAITGIRHGISAYGAAAAECVELYGTVGVDPGISANFAATYNAIENLINVARSQCPESDQDLLNRFDSGLEHLADMPSVPYCKP